MRVTLLLGCLGAVTCMPTKELFRKERVVLPGVKMEWNDDPFEHDHAYFDADELPENWDWRAVGTEKVSYVTKSLNQHIPYYCGSCWAHGSMSSLADRIKIARKGRGEDYNLAIQFILNCGTKTAGSCHGGSEIGAFSFVKENGFIPYDTCLQYAACSSESKEGDCPKGNYECSAINTCRTCNTFSENGGFCSQIDYFPNASIASYGQVPPNVEAIKKEIYARGPVACGINAEEILTYTGGIINMPNASREITHTISTVGWGTDKDGGYWIVRNSWGQYWGEMGYFRIRFGSLGMEDGCFWATPAHWTEHNVGCYEDGTNCVRKAEYVDPHITKQPLGRILHHQHNPSRTSPGIKYSLE